MENDPGARRGHQVRCRRGKRVRGRYAAAPRDKKPGPVPFWKHPYFRIAVVLVVLFFLIVLFILMGGCLQPGERNGTVTATQTTGPSPAPMVVTPDATPPITLPPTRTPTSPPSPTPTVPAETAATVTATPPFPMVPGKLSDDPYLVSTSSLAARVHELVNEQRAVNGLASLAVDPGLPRSRSTTARTWQQTTTSRIPILQEKTRPPGERERDLLHQGLWFVLYLRRCGEHLPEQPLHFGDRHKWRLLLRVEYTGRDRAVNRHRLDEQHRAPEKYPDFYLRQGRHRDCHRF